MINDKHPAVIIRFSGWECHFEDGSIQGKYCARVIYRNNVHCFTWYGRRNYNAVHARRLLKSVKECIKKN